MKARVFCAVLFLGAVLAPPRALPFADETPKAPQISVSPEHFDFGSVLPDQKVTREFVIRNVGSADLNIDKVSTSCGCTVADGYSPLVKPGAKTVLRVTVSTPHAAGHLQKSVLVHSNDATRATVELKVEATVSAPAQ